MRVLLRSAVVVLVFQVLQVSLFSRVRLDGVQADLMLLLAIAGGLVGGSRAGARLGFAAGLAGDLFLETPLGLAALTGALVGFAVGWARGATGDVRLLVPLVSGVAAGAGVVLFAALGAVVGQGHLWGPRLPVVVLVVATVDAVLAPVALKAVTWALAPSLRNWAERDWNARERPGLEAVR